MGKFPAAIPPVEIHSGTASDRWCQWERRSASVVERLPSFQFVQVMDQIHPPSRQRLVRDLIDVDVTTTSMQRLSTTCCGTAPESP